jgi:hypothetical protein
MRWRVRWWFPGVVCLLGGLAGRIALEWDGIQNGRLQYAEIALWRLGWYALGWFLIGVHLARAGAGVGGRGASRAAWWVMWGLGVVVSGFAVLSSCPP